MADNTYTNISDLPTLDSVGENTWVPVEIAGKQGKKVDLSTIGGEQKQADWNQSDSTKPDFIKNKPDVIPPDGKTIVTSGGKLTVKLGEGLEYSNSKSSIRLNYGTGGAGQLMVENDKVYVNADSLAGNGLFADNNELAVKLDGTGGLSFDDDCIYVDVDNQTLERASNGTLRLKNFNEYIETGAVPVYDGEDIEWKKIPEALYDTDTANVGDVLTFDGDDVVWSAASELSTNESTLDINDSVLSFDTSEASDGSVLTYVGNGEVSWQPCNPKLDLESIDSSGGTDFSSIQIAGYKNAAVDTVPIKTSKGIDWVELPDVPEVDGLTIVNDGGTLNVDTDGLTGDGIISTNNRLNINVGNGLIINDNDNKLQIDIEGSGGCLHFDGQSSDRLSVRYDGRSINSESTNDATDNYMLEINGFKYAGEDTIPIKTTSNSEHTPSIKWLPFVKSSYIRAKTASVNDRFKFHLEVVIDDIDDGNNPHEWHFEWVEDV